MTTIRITLTGLKQAGKKSIIHCLKTQFHYIFSPIIAKQNNPLIEFIGGNISTIFPAEQDEKHSSIELSQTNYLIYVIDIQKQESYEENIEYFEHLISELKLIDNELQILILFHKIDDADGKLHYQDSMYLLLKQLLNVLKYHPIPIFHHVTSIFHPFTIFSAFSRPIIQKHGIFSPINYILSNFAQNFHFNHLSVFTNNLIQLGLYDVSSANLSTSKEAILNYISQNRSVFQVQPEIKYQRNNYIYHFQKFYLKNSLSEVSMFLIWSKDQEVRRKIIDEVYHLQENIQFFLSEFPLSFLT